MSLIRGEKIRLFSDEYRTPVDAQSAAEGLLWATTYDDGGVLHLGGKTRLSRYEMGMLILKILNKSNSNIQSVLQKDITPAAPRPLDVSLDSSKAYALGYKPLDIKSALKKMIKQMEIASTTQCLNGRSCSGTI